MPKKLLIIDGNSIVNRAFFGVRPLTTRDGLPTNAVYGFLTILHRHLTAVNPDYAAIAYDLREPTFRHKLYDGYKANRHGMPDELAAQMPWAKKCAHALGLTELTLAGYEADDILGTMARRAEEAGAECCILTGDRDSLQLISDTTCVLLATNTETVTMDRRAFSEKYGIRPEQFVDVKALMGDSSDNIPGVAGVGEKTALKLISQMGTLENVYADLAALPVGPSVRAKLEAGHESALLSRTLAQICTDAPVPSSVEDCAYHGIDRAELYELCTRLEFSALVKRLGLEADPAPEQILPVSSLTDEQAQALPAEPLYAALYTGSDFLLCDGAQVYHVPAVPPALRLCVHDAKAFYRQTGIREQIEFDLSLAAYLLAPSAADYAPDRLCVTYLGTSLSAGDDAAVTAFSRLAPVLQAKLDETNQASLLRRIELPLAFVLADMEKCGFLIDPEGLRRFGEQLDETARQCAEQIYFHATKPFNINSPRQLGEVLFETLGLPAVKKTKTGYSTNAEVLEKLRPYHPIIDLILDYRRVVKLKSTYVDGLLREADDMGRVHTSFHQTVTATGRLSSTEPNLQNIPVRTQLGREMRRFFCAAPGYLLVDADYSQIELRLLAHISGDETMIRAFRDGIDIHTVTASQVFGVPQDQVTPEMRKSAKAVNFGIVYGISDFSLAQDIGVTKAEAARYIQSYFARYPKVSEYLSAVVEQAHRDGFVSTLFGRRREIPELSSTKKTLVAFGERVAMNSPIQGTAADVIKLAMLAVDRALRQSGLDARLILQIHDELIVEVRQDQASAAAEILKREMESATDFSVPLTADVHVGSTWYDTH